MALVRVGVCVCVAALAACGGTSGGQASDAGNGPAPPPASPSISGITPSRVFLARTIEVTLSGYATHWSSSTKVDFGPGIEVQSLAPASATALVARIATTRTTPTGTRDVTVDDGTARERYVGAFDVAPPIAATFEGVVAQGSLGRVTLQVIDTSTPLDVTSMVSLAGDVTYPDLALTLPAGVTNQGISTVSDYALTFALAVDVDASVAAGDVDLVSGARGSKTEFPLPSGIRVSARTATPLVSGTAATGSTTAAYDSALYAFAPPVMAVVDFWVTSSDGYLDPAVALLPSTGHFADLIGFGFAQTTVAAAGEPLYAVYWENTGGTGPYAVTATEADVAQTAAATAADQTWRGAVTVSALPFVLTRGDLGTPYGADWIKLILAQKTRVHVQTAGDAFTDARVVAYASDAMTPVGTPIDSGNAADGTFSFPAAGTYYVEFMQGASFAPPHTKYTGILRVD